MITGEQMRAARALARIEQIDLAEATGLSLPTIKRLEMMRGAIQANTGTEAAIRLAFAELGVILIEENGEGSGVRLQKAGHPLKIRERVDQGIAQLRESGCSPLEIRLTLVEATILASALSRDDPPHHYAGIPLVPDLRAARSCIRASRPGFRGRVHRVI